MSQFVVRNPRPVGPRLEEIAFPKGTERWARKSLRRRATGVVVTVKPEEAAHGDGMTTGVMPAPPRNDARGVGLPPYQSTVS